MRPKPAERRRRPENIFLGIAVLVGVCWIVDRAFVEPAKMQAVLNAKERYLTTKQGGSAGDLCAQAGQVKQAYIQANDSQGAADWNSVERTDCEPAAYPQR